MSLPIRFLPEARTEFDAAADWYGAQRAGLGVDFIARVRTLLARIADNPRLHGMVEGDVRKAVISRFPYVVPSGRARRTDRDRRVSYVV